MKLSVLSVVSSVLIMGCDKPSSPAPAAASAAAAPSAGAAAPLLSAVPLATATPSASASATAAAAPAASASASTSTVSNGATPQDVLVTVRNPVAETQKTIKAPLGGSVTLYLPDFPGTVWGVGEVDKTLGKAKEEVIPGFAGPSTPGHQFMWTTKNPLLKAGQSHKVQLVNKKGGKPSGTTFTLTIDLV